MRQQHRKYFDRDTPLLFTSAVIIFIQICDRHYMKIHRPFDKVYRTHSLITFQTLVHIHVSTADNISTLRQSLLITFRKTPPNLNKCPLSFDTSFSEPNHSPLSLNYITSLIKNFFALIK